MLQAEARATPYANFLQSAGVEDASDVDTNVDAARLEACATENGKQATNK
jgi:hypothetical protein